MTQVVLTETVGKVGLIRINRPVGVTLPSHIVMKVVESEPGVKGDSANNPTKLATLETGYKIQVPLFVKEGERIKIDTRTGDYIERVNT